MTEELRTSKLGQYAVVEGVGELLKLIMLGTASLSLVACIHVGAAVIGESNFTVAMHNPSNGKEALCGLVERGELSQSDLDYISRCVADYASKGFTVDKSSKP